MRNTVVMIVLALLAAATGLLRWQRAAPDPAPAADEITSPLGYYIHGARVLGTDEQGRVAYRVFAARLEERPGQQRVLLESARVEYQRVGETAWTMSAASATAPKDISEVNFVGDVKLENSPADGSEPMTTVTQKLLFSPDRSSAETDEAVTISVGDWHIEAIGLRVDLKSDTLELESQVMACFSPVRALLGCFALALGTAGVAQDDASQSEAIALESESMTADSTSNLFVARRPRITQGDLSIEAEEATATSIDFSERSEWRFTGNVRIAIGTAVLESASAVFTFENERLSRGDLIGTPVRFTDFDEARQTPIQGRAQQISYDYVARKLRLAGDASVQRGRTQVLGCDLVYDFAAAERDAGFVVTSGSANCDDKFRVLQLPDPEGQPAATDTPR